MRASLTFVTVSRAALAAVAVALSIGAVIPLAAHAQDRSWPPQYRRDKPQFALEAAGSLASLSGNAVGAATDGGGFDVMGSVGVSVLSLGGGYQRSTHSLAGGDAIVSGFFFEPRVALPFAARNFTPFAYGRVSRLERNINNGLGGQNTGTGLGAGLGTYVWIAPHVQLSTSVGWTDMRFGALADAPDDGRTTGSSWGVRAGLALGFDRWGR